MNTRIRSFDAQSRAELEQSIIGAVLLESAYGRIGRFLSPKNFINPNHQVIWKSFEDLWPDKPIDLRSIHHRLVTHYGKHMAPLLSLCTTRVNSAGHIEYHCLTLIELDIATKLIKMVQETPVHQADSVLKEAVNEVLHKVQNEHEDLLQILEDASEYLHRIDPEHPLTSKISSFNKAIAEKAAEIKKNYPVRSLLHSLQQLGTGSDFSKKLAIDDLAEALILLINSKAVSPDFLNELTNIKKKVAA